MRRTFLPLMLLMLAGCDLTSPSRQLSLVLQATPSSAAVGDTISFVATAQGTALDGIRMTYGDGTSDNYTASGGTTAQVLFRHAYQAPGTFQVQGTVTDSRSGTKTTSLSVAIQ